MKNALLCPSDDGDGEDVCINMNSNRFYICIKYKSLLLIAEHFPRNQ